jgi:hypothetical protein
LFTAHLGGSGYASLSHRAMADGGLFDYLLFGRFARPSLGGSTGNTQQCQRYYNLFHSIWILLISNNLSQLKA